MTAQGKTGFEIPANALKTVRFPVQLNASGVGDQATVGIDVDGKSWESQVRVMPTVKTYLTTGEEGKAEQLLKSAKDPSVHQATFRVSHDDRNLNLAVDVKDSTPSGLPGDRQPWEQDCIELFFDAAPDFMPSSELGRYHDRVGRLFILPYAKPGQQLLVIAGNWPEFNPASMKAQVDVLPTGYAVKLAIPLEALRLSQPLKGKCIGFDIAVDNALASGKANQQLLWNSSGNAYMDRCSFGFLRFE